MATYASSSDVGVNTVVSRGWEVFSKYMGLAIGGYVILLAISIVGGMIPFVSILFSLLIAPALTGGFIVFVLKLVNDDNPSIGDIFSGFQAFGKWLGVFWLFYAITLATMVPVGIAALIALVGMGLARGEGGASGAAVAVMIIGGLISLVIMVAVMIRLMFVYFAAADGYSVMDAFRRSWAVTAGQEWRLLWIAIVVGLLALAGAVACGIGILFTAPLSACAFGCLYTAVKAERPDASAPIPLTVRPAGPPPPPYLPPPPPAETAPPAEPPAPEAPEQ